HAVARYDLAHHHAAGHLAAHLHHRHGHRHHARHHRHHAVHHGHHGVHHGHAAHHRHHAGHHLHRHHPAHHGHHVRHHRHVGGHGVRHLRCGLHGHRLLVALVVPRLRSCAGGEFGGPVLKSRSRPAQPRRRRGLHFA